MRGRVAGGYGGCCEEGEELGVRVDGGDYVEEGTGRVGEGAGGG